MPHLMNIGGETTIVSDTDDFIELVDHYMGYDARSYIEEQLGKVERLEREIEERRLVNEMMVEAHNLMLYDIITELEAIMEIMDRPPMNGPKVLRSLNRLVGNIKRNL